MSGGNDIGTCGREWKWMRDSHETNIYLHESVRKIAEEEGKLEWKYFGLMFEYAQRICVWMCVCFFFFQRCGWRIPSQMYRCDGIAKPKKWHLNYCTNMQWMKVKRKTGRKCDYQELLAQVDDNDDDDDDGGDDNSLAQTRRKYNNFPIEWIAPSTNNTDTK